MGQQTVQSQGMRKPGQKRKLYFCKFLKIVCVLTWWFRITGDPRYEKDPYHLMSHSSVLVNKTEGREEWKQWYKCQGERLPLRTTQMSIHFPRDPLFCEAVGDESRNSSCPMVASKIQCFMGQMETKVTLLPEEERWGTHLGLKSCTETNRQL